MQTFVVKLASGIAAFVASICLSLNNLKSGTDTSDTDKVKDFSEGVSAASKNGLRTTMTVIPIVGLILAVIVFKKAFKLDEKKIEEIAAELASRNKEVIKD
jgi:melibiose permease